MAAQMTKAAMMQTYLKQMQKLGVKDFSAAKFGAIVDNLGAANYRADAQLVAAKDEMELEGVYTRFVHAHSVDTRKRILALPWPADLAARYEKMAAESVAAQKRIEESDTMPFEVFRQQYVSRERLGLGRQA